MNIASTKGVVALLLTTASCSITPAGIAPYNTTVLIRGAALAIVAGATNAQISPVPSGKTFSLRSQTRQLHNRLKPSVRAPFQLRRYTPTRGASRQNFNCTRRG